MRAHLNTMIGQLNARQDSAGIRVGYDVLLPTDTSPSPPRAGKNSMLTSGDAFPAPPIGSVSPLRRLEASVSLSVLHPAVPTDAASAAPSIDAVSPPRGGPINSPARPDQRQTNPDRTAYHSRVSGDGEVASSQLQSGGSQPGSTNASSSPFLKQHEAGILPRTMDPVQSTSRLPGAISSEIEASSKSKLNVSRADPSGSALESNESLRPAGLSSGVRSSYI